MYIDRRRRGTPKWFLEKPDDWFMLIPRDLLSCVVFIGQNDATGGTVKGTAFIVRVLDGDGDVFLYLVTADHCVWDYKTNTPRRELFAGIDLPTGVHPLELPDGDKWYRSDSPLTVDIAVYPLPPDVASYLFVSEYRWVPLSMFFSEIDIGDSPTTGIGVGDAIATIGLFSYYAGVDRTEPAVRMGNLAMVPDDYVETDERGPMRVYLVELRSLKGLSGSPVFVQHRAPVGAEQVTHSLLGVMLGHFTTVRTHEFHMTPTSQEPLNVGVGMVAPAEELRKLLLQEDVVQRRADDKPKDKGIEQDWDDEEADEFERFQRLTKQLVNTPKPKSEEKSGK